MVQSPVLNNNLTGKCVPALDLADGSGTSKALVSLMDYS